MQTIDTVRGVIFDLNDTLLDNGPENEPKNWLHARSRLAAVQQIGIKSDINALANLSPEANTTAFVGAELHPLESAI